jgi:hypothetical protein
MKGRAIRTLVGIGLLILSIVLAARGAALVAAAPLPTTATPTTAHLSMAMTMGGTDTATGETYEVSARGEGDLDNARQAAQFSYEMTLPAELVGTDPLPSAITIAMVMVDGRLYTRDPDTQQWMWMALPDGYATQQLAPDFNDFGAAFGGTAPEFLLVGPADVNGAATTHWHAEYDLAEMFDDPAFAPESGAGPLPSMLMTIDIWIGDADSYVHRAKMGMHFSIPEEDGIGGDFSMTMMQTYSNFDQPVEIVAPADAVQMADGDTSGMATSFFPPFGGLPLDNSTFGMPGGGGTIAGSFPGAGGAGGASPAVPVASPTPRRNNGGIVIATAEPTASAKPSPTATIAPTQTPTALPPTATAAIVANASVPPTVAVQPQTAAAPAAQESPAAPTARSNSLPLILGAAGLALLIVLSGGLIVAGRQMGAK